MTTAAKISIAIDAQTASLQKGFGEAKLAIKELDAGMSRNVAGGMAMFTAGLAAVEATLATIRGAIGMVMASFDEMDKTADFAARLGVSSDQLVALGYAAQQSGSDADSLNAALEKMQKNLGEAADGSKTARAAFEQLGLNVEDLKGKSADQVFAAVADAMQNVGSSTEKTKIALDIFGKAGGGLIQTLDLGSAGLNAMGAEAESLGLMLGDAREGVAGVNDSIDKMKAAWGGLVSQIAIAVAPALEMVASALATVVGWFNQLLGQGTGAQGAFATFQQNAAKATSKATEHVKATEKAAVKAAAKIDDAFAKIPKPTDFTTPGIGALTRASGEGFSAVQAAERAKQDNERRHRDLITWLAKINQTQRDTATRVVAVGV